MTSPRKAKEEIHRIKQKKNIMKVYVHKQPKEVATKHEDLAMQPPKQAAGKMNLDHLT